MDVSESYVRLCGEVSHFTKDKTGVSLVDAYFGPDYLKPDNQEKNRTPQDLIHSLTDLIDRIPTEIDSKIRADHLIGECESIKVVVEWLSGKSIPYAKLVEGLFHIPLKKFSEKAIDKRIQDLDEALADYPGTDLKDRAHRYNEDGALTGGDLKELIEKELQPKTINVGEMFKSKIYTLLGTKVTDNGVEYQTVTKAPWSGYNWYQRGFKSINQFNLSTTFKKDSLQSVIYHEYEHHVSNLWREKYYQETGNLELTVVPLHTGRCVISEGTADTAKDFLGVDDDDPQLEITEAFYILRRMTSVNAAIMINDEGKSVEEAVEYLAECGLRTTKSAVQSIDFIKTETDDGLPNFWAPYVFTYFFGRTDFVLPTFKKAIEENELPRFFQTLYLNPYSGSSVTWKDAYKWLM